MNRYVGEGVEEVTAPPPPPPGPAMAASAAIPQGSGVPAAGARPGPRRPGGEGFTFKTAYIVEVLAARYANPFANSTPTTGGGNPMQELPGGMLPPIPVGLDPGQPKIFMPVPTQGDEDFNPFSDNPSAADGSQQ